jgi:hypothetical protein
MTVRSYGAQTASPVAETRSAPCHASKRASYKEFNSSPLRRGLRLADGASAFHPHRFEPAH